MEHPSLTSLDLSNDDSNLNKNRLSNAGLEAVMDAMLDPRSQSVISMLNFAQNNVLSSQPETFRLLKVLLTVKGEQMVALNLSDNELGPDFLGILGHESLQSLRDLRLANTRLNNKSLSDLADFHTHHKF